MDTTFLIALTVTVLAAIWVILIFNKLVKARQLMTEAASGIDVQLKRRADLIPKLVKMVKAYGDHEKMTFTLITELRTEALDKKRTDLKTREAIEKKITKALGDLLAVGENYPELKANENFVQLMGDLSDIEEHIQMARRYFNGTVRKLNILVESFPSNFVARLFDYEEEAFFELESLADRLPPNIVLDASKEEVS